MNNLEYQLLIEARGHLTAAYACICVAGDQGDLDPAIEWTRLAHDTLKISLAIDLAIPPFPPG